MRFADISGAHETFVLKCKKCSLFLTTLIGKRVFIQKTVKGNYFLTYEIGTDIFPVSDLILDLDTKYKIDRYLKNIYTNIFTVERVEESNSQESFNIVVRRRIFEKRAVDINFYIDGRYKRSFENTDILTSLELRRNPWKLMENIEDEFIIKGHGTSYIVAGIYNGPQEKSNEILKDVIVIQGKSGYIVAKKEEVGAGNYIYRLGIDLPVINANNYYFVLLSGNIGITEEKEAACVSNETQKMLEISEKKYVGIWKEFEDMEESEIEKKYEEAGVLTYSCRKSISENETSFEIEKDSRDSYEEFLNRLNDFMYIAEQEEDTNVKGFGQYKPMKFKYVDGSIEDETIILKDNGENRGRIIPEKGKIEINIAGYRAMSRRRKESLESFKNNKVGILQIPFLLENHDIHGEPVKSRVRFPITPEIRERHFSHGITTNQREAVKIALETPDIAMVQGPPGAGKTTVICAIVERIIEEYAHIEDNPGDILICSYQHDAVENAIERIDVNGLPVMKFGSRGGVKDSDEVILTTSVDEWIRKHKDKLREKYPTVQEKIVQRDYTELYVKFFKGTNSIAGIVKILKEAEEIFQKNGMADLVDRANKIRKKMETVEKRSSPTFLNAIYNIPVCPQHMSDNGEQYLCGGYQVLENSDKPLVKEAGKALKEIYENWRNKNQELDFEKIAKIKDEMLLEFLPVKSIFVDKKRYVEVEKLLEDGKIRFDESLKESQSIEEIVAGDFMYDLENHPEFIQDALKNYMQVIGATCQQAASNQIINYKRGINTYSVVIIDEAARANPLDLMIPVSKARDKVIFVGDHRQLPHIVEERKIKQLENDLIRGNRESDVEQEDNEKIIEEIEEMLKKSLFQRLFESLKEREKVDGIKRVVTLDTQFRMHPLLGKFISENFYENRDGIEIKSGRKAHEFVHSLPGLENKACVWMDVPFAKGREISGKSKTRKVEAEQIARHLKEMMDSPAGQGMTFGIITFYKRQVNVVMRALVDVGIAQISNSGRITLKDEYRFSETEDNFGKKSYKERLLVGTVDAFQGKEFDVVYLSVVRSNRNRNVRRKYGYLIVENRMCVAMSRQKKLLIAVGDSNMVTGKDAEKYIGPLNKFYKLCKENKEYGKILDYIE